MNKHKLTVIAFTTLLIGSVTAQSTGPALEGVVTNTDPSPVQAGEDAEITYRIVNDGDETAQDLTVGVVDTFPFDLKPDRTRNYTLGDLAPGRGIRLPMTEVMVSENAPDGNNDFKIKINTENGVHTETFPVTVQNQDIEMNLANLKTSPSQLKPDMDNVQLTVETVNNGERTAENVVVETDLPEGFEQTSSFSVRQSIGDVRPGRTKPAVFSFDINQSAEKGEISIPTDITYSSEESDTRITEENNFKFYLAGKPSFELEKETANLTVGQEGKVRLNVRNTGSETSSSTRIRVLDSSDQPFSYGSSSQYIGTLDPGQEGTAVFEVTPEKGADQKEYLVDFEMRGVKGTETYVEDSTSEIMVSEPEEEGSNLSVILIGIAVAGVIGLYLSRKKVISFIKD